MKYYQEVTLKRDARIELYDYWKTLYQQTHLALVQNKTADNQSAVGVAFPEYEAAEYSLGTKLRLFAPSKQPLEDVNIKQWLARLNDYVHISSIREVPEQVAGHAIFRQIKPKGSKENLARRRAKRKGESLEQALAHYAHYQPEQSRLPYINMDSQSTGQRFRLFIKKETKPQPQTGLYNGYGLSKTHTVPLF